MEMGFRVMVKVEMCAKGVKVRKVSDGKCYGF